MKSLNSLKSVLSKIGRILCLSLLSGGSVLFFMKNIQRESAKQKLEPELELLLTEGNVALEKANAFKLEMIYKTQYSYRKFKPLYENALDLIEAEKKMWAKLEFWQENAGRKTPADILNQLFETYLDELEGGYAYLEKIKELFVTTEEMEELRKHLSGDFEDDISPSTINLQALKAQLAFIKTSCFNFNINKSGGTCCMCFSDFRPTISFLPATIRQGEQLMTHIILGEYDPVEKRAKEYYLQGKKLPDHYGFFHTKVDFSGTKSFDIEVVPEPYPNNYIVKNRFEIYSK